MVRRQQARKANVSQHLFIVTILLFLPCLVAAVWLAYERHVNHQRLAALEVSLENSASQFQQLKDTHQDLEKFKTELSIQRQYDARVEFLTTDRIDLLHNFHCVISRKASQPGDLALIQKAESLAPNHPLVIWGSEANGGFMLPIEGERYPKEWWFKTFDDIRVASAVNKNTIAYYTQKIEDLRAKTR